MTKKYFLRPFKDLTVIISDIYVHLLVLSYTYNHKCLKGDRGFIMIENCVLCVCLHFDVVGHSQNSRAKLPPCRKMRFSLFLCILVKKANSTGMHSMSRNLFHNFKLIYAFKLLQYRCSSQRDIRR